MNENALIKKCQKGNQQAFEELIRLYYPYVSGFLLKMTTDNTLTEDLTQDTFLKMIRNIEKYDPGGSASFGTWLITIARNCYIDDLRRNRRQTSLHLEDIDGLTIADSRDIAAEVDQKLQYEDVLRAIETLPPEQGLAIRLKYVEDMTLAEIAERFGVPSKTVKSRIYEGKVKLRKLLKIKERTDDV